MDIKIIIGICLFVLILGFLANPVLDSRTFEYNSIENQTSNPDMQNEVVHAIDLERNIGTIYFPDFFGQTETVGAFYCPALDNETETFSDLDNECDFSNNGKAHIQFWDISFVDGYNRDIYITTSNTKTPPSSGVKYGSNVTINILKTNYTNKTNPYYMNSSYKYKSNEDWNIHTYEDSILNIPIIIGVFVLMAFVLALAKIYA